MTYRNASTYQIPANKNKYKNGILPMLLINFSIGSVYCWTIFKDHIIAETGFSRSTLEWSFSLAIFFLGMSAAFGGKIVERNPKQSAFLTFIFFTTGWALTGLGIYLQIAPLVVVAFGVIQGIGLGLGYITPVKTMMIWLADHKGFAAGLTIAGFGLAGVIANPIIGGLLGDSHEEGLTVYQAFFALTILYGIALFIGYRLLYRPASPETVVTPFEETRSLHIIREPKFLALWVVVFLNISAGLALISQEKQIYDYVRDNTMAFVVLLASITALANLLGRILMGSLQDRLSVKHIPYYVMTLGSLVACLIAVFSSHWIVTAFVLVFTIQFFFGTGFACLPNILDANWGMSRLSTVHGLVLSAWGVAGLVGNQFSAAIMTRYNLRVEYLALAAVYLVQFLALLVFHRLVTRSRGAAITSLPTPMVGELAA